MDTVEKVRFLSELRSLFEFAGTAPTTRGTVVVLVDEAERAVIVQRLGALIFEASSGGEPTESRA